MKIYRFLRDADGSVLAVVILVVAALIGTLGLTMGNSSFDTTQWPAVSSAHAIVLPPDAKDSTDARARDTWLADESAQGTRPDAAH